MWIIVVIVIIAYTLIIYNSLISRKNKVKQARSSVDIYLTQRFELIPNLIECVKGYMNYEKEILEEIAKQRSKYMETKSLKEGEELNNKCNQIIAVAENYPELKANEQFLNLQKNLSKMESQLQAARRIYNADVTIYNNKVQMFPSNILANIFGFKEEELFQADAGAKNNIQIK